MQALCPHCSQKIVIEDAKVPDRPFAVKCPKCQSVVKLAGKGGPATAATPPSRPAPPNPPSASAPEPATPAPSGASGGEGSSAERTALVALDDASQAAALTACISRLGYAVESPANGNDADHLLERGAYALVVTTRRFTAGGQGDTLYQRLVRLSPDSRREIFLVLVGDEFKSADGTQAWAALADLVLSPRDAAHADKAIRAAVAERQRLYQVFRDARSRFEAAAG